MEEISPIKEILYNEIKKIPEIEIHQFCQNVWTSKNGLFYKLWNIFPFDTFKCFFLIQKYIFDQVNTKVTIILYFIMILFEK